MVPTVFISSTVEDLKPYRTAVRDAATAARFLPVMQEYFVARDNPPVKECLERVSAADVLVVVVAHRYGWAPEGQDKIITWLECEQAVKRGKELLAFLVDDSLPWPVELREAYRLTAAVEEGKLTPELAEEVSRNVSRLRGFRQWLNSRGIRATFTNPEDLRGKVESALREWRERHPEVARSAPAVSKGRADPTTYLEYLRDETAYMDIRGLQTGEAKAHRFSIEEIYIPLANETPEQEEAVGKRRAEKLEPRERERLPLQQALSHPKLMIVGDPGSGKSTFLKRVAFALCQTALGVNPDAAEELLGTRDRSFPILIRITELVQYAWAAIKWTRRWSSTSSASARAETPRCLPRTTRRPGWVISSEPRATS